MLTDEDLDGMRHGRFGYLTVENTEALIVEVIARRGDLPLTKIMEPITPTFESELEVLINRYSLENGSDTPDFLLARYLVACLVTWNQLVRDREQWYRGPVAPTVAPNIWPLPPNVP